MVTPFSQVAPIVLAHGALGLWDEIGCFVALLIIALAVVLVYGRDLMKPASPPNPAGPSAPTESESKQP